MCTSQVAIEFQNYTWQLRDNFRSHPPVYCSLCISAALTILRNVPSSVFSVPRTSSPSKLVLLLLCLLICQCRWLLRAAALSCKDLTIEVSQSATDMQVHPWAPFPLYQRCEHSSFLHNTIACRPLGCFFVDDGILLALFARSLVITSDSMDDGLLGNHLEVTAQVLDRFVPYRDLSKYRFHNQTARERPNSMRHTFYRAFEAVISALQAIVLHP